MKIGAVTVSMRILAIHLPFAALLYLVRFHVGPLPTTLLEVYLGALFVTFTWSQGWSGWRRGWDRLDAWRGPVAAWWIVTLIAVAVAPDHVAGLGLWRAYALEPLLALVILAETIKTETDARALRRHLFLSVILVTLWGVIQFATGRGIPHPWNVSIAAGRRATGPFPYPNALALFTVPIGAWAFGLWMRRADSHKLQATSYKLIFATWIAALVAVLLAKSVGGFAGLAVAMLAVLLAEQRTRRATLAGLAAIIFAVGLIAPLRSRVVRQVTFREWSGQVRLTIWRETWNMLKDHPVFGAGFGAYPAVIKPYHKATYLEIFQYPHNILLNLWSETGLLGVIVFGWIIVTWIVLGRCRGMALCLPSGRSEGDRKGTPLRTMIFIAPLLALLIHGLVDVPYFKNDLALIFWLLIFLTTVPSPDGQRS